MMRKFVKGGLRENDNAADVTTIPNEFDGASSSRQNR
jgi:hypothetical protein